MSIVTAALRATTLIGLMTFALASSESLAAEMPNEAKTEVCALKYADVKTDSGDMASWAESFSGRIETKARIAYRTVVLEPGSYDTWIAPAKKPGHFYFCIGDKANEESEDLRALFKLYDEEESVAKLTVELKEIRKGTKVKFSIRGGKTEGHGNLRVVAPEPAAD